MTDDYDYDTHWHEALRDYEAYRERRLKIWLNVFIASIFLCSVAILMIAWRLG